jgi:excisionase family DNA binding protein
MPPLTLGEQFLSIADAAELFKVNHRTIRTLIKDGKIRAIRVGAQIRIEPAELRRYLEDNPARGGDAA